MWIADCRFVFQVVSGLETRGQYLRDVLRGSSILPAGLRRPGFVQRGGGLRWTQVVLLSASPFIQEQRKQQMAKVQRGSHSRDH